MESLFIQLSDYDLKKNRPLWLVQGLIMWNIIKILNNSFLFEYILNLIYSCDKFSASFLQSSVSNYLSEINLIYWFGAQEKLKTFVIMLSLIA